MRWIHQSKRCPNCEGDTLRNFFAFAHDGLRGETVSITECPKCHLAWQPVPARSPNQSVNHFDLAYRPAVGAPTGYFDRTAKERIVELQLDFLRKFSKSSGNLLDVGGGSGSFASAAQLGGWRSTAVDPALDVDYLSQRGVQAYRGYIDTLPLDITADVITAWDVIEHVESPLIFLDGIMPHLERNGHLVLSTGNYMSANRILGGEKHWIYQLDHRWYFSPSTLSSLLVYAGFKVIYIGDTALRPNWSGSRDYSGPSLRWLLSDLRSQSLRVTSTLRRFFELRQAARWPRAGVDIFTVIAMKS